MKLYTKELIKVEDKNKEIEVNVETFPLFNLSNVRFLEALIECDREVYDNEVLQDYIKKLYKD